MGGCKNWSQGCVSIAPGHTEQLRNALLVRDIVSTKRNQSHFPSTTRTQADSTAAARHGPSFGCHMTDTPSQSEPQSDDLHISSEEAQESTTVRTRAHTRSSGGWPRGLPTRRQRSAASTATVSPLASGRVLRLAGDDDPSRGGPTAEKGGWEGVRIAEENWGVAVGGGVPPGASRAVLTSRHAFGATSETLCRPRKRAAGGSRRAREVTRLPPAALRESDPASHACAGRGDTDAGAA
ncbi:hypothetical protein MRX96_003780 [Rhipicephalus microplus]